MAISAQCFQIESILVDACGAQEGLNEMVRFKVGPAPLNTTALTVSWPNNPWQGLVKNATTAARVTALNQDILAAGGCGQILEPVGNMLPANAEVILVTSFNMSTALNSFGAISEDYYMLFQNNPANANGHFANFGTGNRTLSMNFGGGCSDTVTYNRALLVDVSGVNIASDGATVNFSPSGAATYTNNGCQAPVPVFSAQISSTGLSGCPGATVSVTGIAQGHQSVHWSAASGTFSHPGQNLTQFTIPTGAGGTITVHFTATNACGQTKSASVPVQVLAGTVPNFATTMSICNGASAPILNSISPNGISGVWNPTTINNTVSGSYVFTPNAGQCAAPVTLNVSVGTAVVPNFATTMSICNGASVPALNSVSPNGISGIWSPSVISNSASGSYVFTPNAGQCAAPVTLNVSVGTAIVPNFATSLNLCNGASAPILNSISPNGISGIWSPSVINNSASGSYVFTPNAGQCAAPVTLNVSVGTAVVPNFATTMSICNGASVPALNSVSPNGISGIWSPSVISNSASGSYVFTPNAGQCAAPVTLNVSVGTAVVPNFATSLNLCNGASAPSLNSVSPNGISGVWNPTTINNTASGSYVFTPNAGQCAAPVTLNVSVGTAVVPNFATSLNLCNGASTPTLNNVSPNGISGIWSPSVINNSASGSYVFTPNAGQCAAPVTLNVSVGTAIVPNFATSLNLCNGASAPILNSISPNGISGIWSPSVINNSASGSYVFTPNAGQCAAPVTLNVSVGTAVVPNFATTMSICNGASAPSLNSVSPNGISGVWNPTTINNTASGSYVFTPNAGQCAAPVTLNVSVGTAIVPNFATTMSICNGASAPTLNNISPNGISGSWSPAAINNTASGSYVFTPNAGQCAAPVTLNVSVGTAVVPNFATTMNLCNGASAPSLNSVSPNGISGVWNPTTINNTASGSYVFTPNAGQCAAPVTLDVVIDALPQPQLEDAVICMDAYGNILQPALLSSGMNPTAFTFQWQWGGSILSETGPTLSATQPGTYTLTVTTPGGCTATTTAMVSILQSLQVRVQTTPDFENNPMITTQVSGGSGHYSYQLDHGGVQDSPVFLNVLPGSHELSVWDVQGCSEVKIPVLILDYPKFFTPNQDGYNDFWNISRLDDPDARIAIYDRYGKLLKIIKASSGSGWDGTYNGNALPATDYWFELTYRDRNRQIQVFKSHFALKR